MKLISIIGSRLREYYNKNEKVALEIGNEREITEIKDEEAEKEEKPEIEETKPEIKNKKTEREAVNIIK